MRIIKRSGEEVKYDGSKIVKAVAAAMMDTNGKVDKEICHRVEQEVLKTLKAGNYPMTVEGVQDSVENTLMSIGSCNEVAKNYILYRNERDRARKATWDMNELQRDIYNNKYRNNNESFDEFIERVSGGNESVAKAIRNKDFLFGGRILAGRGLDRNITLSNCYVLPSPEDSIESIFDTAKYAARTYSYGGGAGFDLSNLRPKGAKVNNAALTTSGAVSFMDLYDVTTKVIGQLGRRAALMLSMSTDHADIDDFIDAKKNTDKITQANISVRANGEFFKLDTGNKRKTLRKIAENNHSTAEPGMLFWDRVEDWHLLSEHPEYVLESTNPCGEQPLIPWGNCLLGSVNLGNFIEKEFTDSASINYEKLKEAIRIGTIGLNEVLHEGVPLHPIQEQRDAANNFRQIGLGIFGLGDMLIKLGITYGSEESLEVSHKIGQLFRDVAIETSVELVDEYGTYPKYDYDIVSQSSYFKSLPKHLQDKIKEKGMANSHVLSVAPTGSISTMSGNAGGVEPIFANSFTRTTKSLSGEGDVDYKVYTQVIEDLMNVKGLTSEDELPEYCITSHEIEPINRIKMQAVWQEYIDSAISSTINLREETTVEEIEDIYVNAYKHGLKGVTVYRDGCHRVGILNIDDKDKKDTNIEIEEVKVNTQQSNEPKCPECGGQMMIAGGCEECLECGFSPCAV